MNSIDWKRLWKSFKETALTGLAGIIMVFLPAATGFAIPEIIGNGKINFIGNVIENYISGAKGVATQYNVGCMISLVIIFLVFGSLIIINKVDAEGETLL